MLSFNHYCFALTESILLTSLFFPQKEQRITEMYSELSQTSKIECFTKIVSNFQPLTVFSYSLFSQNTLSLMFDRILDLLLDYLEAHKRSATSLPCLTICITFEKECFSGNILLINQVSLSGCLNFTRNWGICVLQSFVNKAVTS